MKDSTSGVYFDSFCAFDTPCKQAETRLLTTSFPGSLGKTLVSAGHVPRPKLIARGGVVKVSNYKQLKT